jgi:hypothetical protein
VKLHCLQWYCTARSVGHELWPWVVKYWLQCRKTQGHSSRAIERGINAIWKQLKKCNPILCHVKLCFRVSVLCVNIAYMQDTGSSRDFSSPPRSRDKKPTTSLHVLPRFKCVKIYHPPVHIHGVKHNHGSNYTHEHICIVAGWRGFKPRQKLRFFRQHARLSLKLTQRRVQ